MRKTTLATIIALIALAMTSPATSDEPHATGINASGVTAEIEAELIAARETAWRAFFDADPTRLEQLLAPELIAIQQSQDRWEDRGELIKMAGQIRQNGVRIARLEFPQTRIQLFGDVAILYYSYIFETALKDWSVTDEGRGTEIFVRRNGRWVDAGWHLDSGPFKRRNGEWVRVEQPGNATPKSGN